MRRLFDDFLFLLTGLAAAAAWFALLLGGWLIVALLSVTPLVVPALLALRWATRGLALGEAALARSLLEVDAHVRPSVPTRPGYVNRIRGVLGSVAFWRQQAYGAIRTTAGFGAGLAAACLVGSSLLVITLPVTYRWVDVWQVDSLGRALASVPVGVVGLAVSAALVHVLARAWAGIADRLLGAAPAAEPGPAARARVRGTGLPEHAAAYALVNVIAIVVWAATTRAYFWPMWPLLALGLPPSIHAVVLESRTVTRRWRAVAIHGGVLGLLALFLVGVWAVTTRAYFWPMWPMFAFVLLVGAHVLAVLAPWSDRAGLEERIDVLETTRAGAVDAAEVELRRIERDLHDGAQARLVALGMSLGLAEQRLAEDPEGARHLLGEARAGAEEALRELRDLARGIHPPVLTDRGLEAALAALVTRSPLPVDVDVDLPERPPALQETTAYFVAAEALANASKHAQATRVAITIGRRNGDLVVRVADDGRGGADAEGRGLVGLSRRVEALDGTVSVESPAGGPTVVEAVLPCVP